MRRRKTKPERTRHPTLWTVEAVRWEFYEHESAYQRLLAKKREKGPGVQLGQQITAIEVGDRELAIAIARHLLNRYAEEAVGTMSLEVHIHPPGRHLEDETVYQVKDEVLEQARELGVEGNIKQQVQRMVRDATPHPDPQATRRFGGYIMRVERGTVTWIGLVDPLPAPRESE
jgi:hypothetical protein